LITSHNEKNERKRQGKKDEEMTKDADELLVIWDGKSKGSKENILRGLKYSKKTEVYLYHENKFLENINSFEIEKIFRNNYGYSATELVKKYKEKFKSTKYFYQILVEKNFLKKIGNIYTPIKENDKYFIIDYDKGKPRGVRFKKELVDIL